MEEPKKEILKGNCSKCGREFSSLYEEQLIYNIKAHELSCKGKKEDKKDE